MVVTLLHKVTALSVAPAQNSKKEKKTKTQNKPPSLADRFQICHTDGFYKQYTLTYLKSMIPVLNQMVQLCWLFFKPHVVIFDGEMLFEMLYMSFDFQVQLYDKFFALKYCHLSEWVYKFRLGSHGKYSRKVALGQKGHGENKDLRSVCCPEEKDQGQLLLTHGQIHSLTHCTRSQLTGLLFQQDLTQPVQSSSRQGLREELQIPTTITSSERGVQGSHCRGWPRRLQRMLREPSRPNTAMTAEHETRVKPVSGVEKRRMSCGLQLLSASAEYYAEESQEGI